MTPTPTLEELNGSYARLAADLGDRVYRIGVLQAECDDLRRKMLALNEQAATLSQPKESPDGR